MPITLIEQLPTFDKRVEGEQKLAISELFVDTIQGEGLYAGIPATFIRLQGCTLQCTWCDTLDVWPHGNEYSFDEILDLLEPHKDKYFGGQQHIILTGGSPLKQQERLGKFIWEFHKRFGFIPWIQVENEAVLMPHFSFSQFVYAWNNSPKLSNSGMKWRARVKPDVLHTLSRGRNSTFKFVVSKEEDWKEIEDDFLPFIKKHQIILMPEGQTQLELANTREITAELAIKHQVRYMDRLHIVLWNKKTGV